MVGDSNSDENTDTDTGVDEHDDTVEVVLNVELCIGVGNCELLQPDHFRIDDDSGVAERIGDGIMGSAAAEQAVDRCPSGALSIRSRR